MKNTKSIYLFIPVMLAFFTMGFVDLVGIATNYMKADFHLSDTLANLFASMIFFWFLVLSLPTGLLMNRIGRKKTVIIGMVVTLCSLLIPLVSYNFGMMIISFILLGIGNTLLQVSLNPLLANIVSPNRMSSSLTFGQFIKAIASFLAPLIAAWAAISFSDWRVLLFPIYSGICLIAIIYLAGTKIDEQKTENSNATFKDCFRLLGDASILLFFIGIMAHVGLDVGINTTAPKLLMQKAGMSLSEAGFASSFYFIFRTFGCLMGFFILSRFSNKKVFLVSVLMIISGILALFSSSVTIIYIGIALFGVGNSNVFPVIFSQALKAKPMQNNEVSGLMIMGIFGGAIIPLLMGIASDLLHKQEGALVILLLCVIYLAGIVGRRIKLY